MFLTQVVNQQSLPFQPTVQGIPVEQPQDEYRPLTKEEENALIMEILTGGKSTDENPTD